MTELNNELIKEMIIVTIFKNIRQASLINQLLIGSV